MAGEEKQTQDVQSQQKAAEKKILKGKVWFSILSPKIFGEKFLGETPAIDADSMKGRTIEASLMDLGLDPSRFYIKLFFKVSEVEGSLARTKFFGHDISKDFLARVVMPGTQRVDTNNVVQFKDGKLRIKTVGICLHKVSDKIEKNMRKRISEHVKEAGKKTIEEFLLHFAGGEFQREVMTDAKKIYPLRIFEVRKTEVIE